MHQFNNRLIHLILAIFSMVLISAPATAAELVSIVDRNEVGMNESFRLQVSYSQQVDSGKLDLSGLANDFEVLASRPQSNSSISIINGQRTQVASTVWSIILAPKRKGMLTIPALKIEQDSSRPIQIKVVGTGEANSNNQPLLVTISTNNSSVYVGQQLVVDVELSAQSDVSNLNGPELVVADADVILLDQQNYQKVENGLARTVVNLKYAVFAKSAGELVIPIMTYTGNQGGQRSLFGSRGRQVIARTTERKIKVLPASQAESHAWFPAENVAISAKWSRDLNELKVGEPITRTVTITAVAQRAAAIPPLSTIPESGDYNSYADQAQMSDKQNKRGFVGTRVESTAIVAVQAGELQIPETRLAWFDVGAKRWKEAVLPAETIVAKGAPLAQPALEPTQGSTPSLAEASPTSSSLRNWQIATWSLAAVALLQLLLLLKMRGAQKASTVASRTNVSENKAWKTLQTSLSKGSASDIRQSLIAWITLAAPNQGLWTLLKIRQEFDSEIDGSILDQSLRELESALFERDATQGNKPYDASSLSSALGALRTVLQSPDTQKSKEPQLVGLYEA